MFLTSLEGDLRNLCAHRGPAGRVWDKLPQAVSQQGRFGCLPDREIPCTAPAASCSPRGLGPCSPPLRMQNRPVSL